MVGFARQVVLSVGEIKMRRREFIALLGGAVPSAMLRTLAAQAQEPARLLRVGIILGGSRTTATDGFLQGMRELGYVAGRDYVAEWRFADGRYARFPVFAQDFVRLKVDAIFLGTAAAVDGVRQVTPTIPIVMGYSTDPVGKRLVASLARPGANVTGMAGSTQDTSPKQLELLQAVVPSLSRVDPAQSARTIPMSGQAAGRRGEPPSRRFSSARNPQEIDRATPRPAGQRVEAVVITDDAHFSRSRAAGRARLTIVCRRSIRAGLRADGGLLSYGESLKEAYRRAASFVDRIFQSANPAELPIEPVPRQLVINVRPPRRSE